LGAIERHPRQAVGPSSGRLRFARFGAAASLTLALFAASAATAQDQAPPEQPAWCQTGAPEASPDSLSLSLIYVPSEYAQVKARTILEGAGFQQLTKEMAADLGIPDQYVQANAYLVRAGGFFQPQGVPDRNVQAFYDPGDGLLQVNTYAASVSPVPVNWAAVVVAPGEVSAVRSICLSTGG
jgi:hypothetical protein